MSHGAYSTAFTSYAKHLMNYLLLLLFKQVNYIHFDTAIKCHLVYQNVITNVEICKSYLK